MKSTALIALVASALMAFASNDHPAGHLPPVLRPLEPADSSVIRLPGRSPVTPKFRMVPVSAPVPKPSPVSSKLVPEPLPSLPFIPSPPVLPAPPVPPPCR